jgi:predicted lipoprotein
MRGRDFSGEKMRKNPTRKVLRSGRSATCFSMAVVFALAACGGPATPDASGAATSVEGYLQARVANNEAQMISLSCADWEAQARVEASSFQAMQAQLEGVTCSTSETAGQIAFVACTGKIVTSYNGENRDWPLDQRAFKTQFEGGEWRVCGYR